MKKSNCQNPVQNLWDGLLVDRFDWLAENPQMGRNRDDIKNGYRCFPEGQHLVFYTVSDDLIDIIGIVHQRQDVSSHLTEW